MAYCQTSAPLCRGGGSRPADPDTQTKHQPSILTGTSCCATCCTCAIPRRPEDGYTRAAGATTAHRLGTTGRVPMALAADCRKAVSWSHCGRANRADPCTQTTRQASSSLSFLTTPGRGHLATDTRSLDKVLPRCCLTKFSTRPSAHHRRQ